VTVNVTGANTGGKQLTEGDYVDIALTIEGDHPDLGKIQTRTLMRNVMIVDAAAGMPLRTSSRNQMVAQRMAGDSITVAVTEADANKLIVAERSGTLSVTLCSAKDRNELVDDTTISQEELLALRKILPPPKEIPPPPAPPPPKRIVESYNGGSRQTIVFDADKIDEAERNTPFVTPGDLTEPVSKKVDEEAQREAVKKLSPFASAGVQK